MDLNTLPAKGKQKGYASYQDLEHLENSIENHGSDSELGEKADHFSRNKLFGIDNKAISMDEENNERPIRDRTASNGQKCVAWVSDYPTGRGNSSTYVSMNRNALHLEYGKKKAGRRVSLSERITNDAANCCGRCSFLGWFCNLFPIFSVLSQYSFKKDLISDIIAGFTIAILHIPQGMAYGLLAGVGAINGLYVSFFPVIIYSIMGTSRHISIGTFAVISIMLSSALNKLSFDTTFAVAGNTTGNHSEFPVEIQELPPTPIEILSTICLITGAMMFVMGFLHMGALSLILSDQIVSSFSCGAAIHVATSQLGSLFDLSLSRSKSGPLKLVYEWINVAGKINQTNIGTLVLAIVTIIVLLVSKEYAEPKIKRRFNLSIPIPVDFFVIVTVTAVSYLANFKEALNIKVMGTIPTGLPVPEPPRMDLVMDVIPSCFTIAIVTFTISLSLAKIFAKRHKYKVDPNHELIALGAANMFSSFFACYPCSASLSRSLVQDTAGGKSQLTGIFSSIIILIVLLFLGPLLYHLPKCILACVILVALKGLFLQIGDVYKTWKISRSEGLTWLITFLSVVLLDIDIGLVVGVCFSICMVLIGFITPHSSLLGELPQTEIYVDIKYFPEAREIPGVKIFQYSSALFFLNRDHFKETLLRTTINVSADEVVSVSSKPRNVNNVRAVIIDCSPISYMDSSGVETITDVIEALNVLSIRCYLCSCSTAVLSMFERTSFFEKISQTSCRIFPSIHDAIVSVDFKN